MVRSVAPAWHGTVPDWLLVGREGISVAVHVQPGARRSAVAGVHGGRLRIAVKEPPAGGRANEAVIALIADRLGVASRFVQIVGGQRQRDKRVAVSAAVSVEDVVARLAPTDGHRAALD